MNKPTVQSRNNKHGKTIQEVRSRYFRIPLEEQLVDAEHGFHSHFEIVTTTVTLADGTEGTGYTYTGGFGGRAIHAMVQQDFTPALIGQDARAVEHISDMLENRVTYVGRGGIASFALASVDIALWDTRCKSLKLPLWRLLGGTNSEVSCYYGGIDLGLTQDELLQDIQRRMTQGHTAFKIKLGQKDLACDIKRVAAVRELLGPNTPFMVDANASWNVQTAMQAAKALQPYNLLWLEEPVEPRDFAKYAFLVQKIDIPIASGENLHNVLQHRQAIEAGISFPQPDASTVGGITNWLRVASVAKSFGLPVCTHGMQELHVSLLAAMPHAGLMEIHKFPIDRYTQRQVVVQQGVTMVPEAIGIGVEFNWDKLESYCVL